MLQEGRGMSFHFPQKATFLFWLYILSTIQQCLGNLIRPINLKASLAGYTIETEEDNPADGTVYDYIIVGAGASGGVVASRLAQRNRYKVLLLEAGPFPPWETIVPYLRLDTRTHSKTDWEFLTVPQKNLDNRTILISQGKMVGGCSSHNGMIYMRGNPQDYNRWAEMTGDPAWNYTNVLKYLKRMESYKASFPLDPYHGSSGPITIEDLSYMPLAKEWVEAGRDLGFLYRDQNSIDQQSSFVTAQMNTRQGRRSSVYEEYIYPAYKAKLLSVLANAYVTKVGFDDSKRAVSVSFHRHDASVTVNARREIILSAGAIKTPQILLISGIGPKEHLESVRIDTVVDLPGVGQGFMDHLSTELGPFLIEKGTSFIESRDLEKHAFLKYILLGRGPLSFIAITGMGLWSTHGDHTWPNMLYEQIFLPTSVSGQPVDAVSVYSILGLLNSRGSISLRSKDPFDQPLIDPNYRGDPQDVIDAVKGARFIIDLFENSKTYKNLGSHLVNQKSPNCGGFSSRHNNDQFVECVIRTRGGTAYHFGSSARMGADDDDMAVLDSKLRVRGVTGLRVVDASAMPEVTNANTHIPCVLIAEVGADLILNGQ